MYQPYGKNNCYINYLPLELNNGGTAAKPKLNPFIKRPQGTSQKQNEGRWNNVPTRICIRRHQNLTCQA